MPSSHPTTREDFVAIGQRFLSEDIVAEIDRLAPIVRKDLEQLVVVGYEQSDLDELLGYRETLSSESADRRTSRGSKKAARTIELKAIRDGKRVLRLAVVALQNALAKRKAPPKEKPESTVHITQTYAAQFDALSGRIGLDSAKLRTRLIVAVALLTAPELQPDSKNAKHARQELVNRAQSAVEKLPGLAETKHALQAASLEDTAGLDEIDGRAYENLKRMCSAGRVVFAGTDHASGYQLNDLHAREKKRDATAKAATSGTSPSKTTSPA